MTASLTSRARDLRRNMTDAERMLWHALRLNQLGVRFRRQAPIGTYIVDFACLECGLVVEVDGGQHAGSVTDPIRDVWLQERGFPVMRLWNNEVLADTGSVVEGIRDALDAPHPDPPPQPAFGGSGGGG
jgi:very-short-patch-repair endonuclease